MRDKGKIAPRKRRATVVAVPLAVTATAAFAAVMTATPAEARCIGTGSAQTISLTSGGTVVAREGVQYASTCDGDNFYAGRVQDSVTDGSCAYAIYHDAGVASTQGVSCTTGGWANYSFRDRNGNNSATIQLAVDYGGNLWSTWGY